jgi:hypothetical protein
LEKGFSSTEGIPTSSKELVEKIDELIGRYAEVLAERIKPEDVEEAFAFYLNRQKEIFTDEVSTLLKKELGKNAEEIDVSQFVEKILGKETGRIAEKQFIFDALTKELGNKGLSPLTLDKVAEKITETFFKAREKAKEEGAYLLADKIARMEGVELSSEQKQKLALNLKNAVIQRRISPHDIIPFAGGLFREKFKGLFKASNFILMMDNMTFKPDQEKDAVILANPLLFNSLYPEYSPLKAFEIGLEERLDRFRNLTGIDLKQVLGETKKLYGPFFFEAVKKSIKHQMDKAREEMQSVSYIQRPV